MPSMVSSENICKNFVGYKDNSYRMKTKCIMLLKMSAYVSSYDGETKWMNTLIKDADFLEKYEYI